MIIDINLADYDRPFIYKLAKHTTLPEVLDEIVEYAINIDHYGQNDEFSYDDDYYMDMVVDNDYLSRASIIKLIHYQGAADIHFGLADTDRICDKELEMMFLGEVEDLSAIDRYFEKHEVSTEIADMVADRLISGKIRTENCFNYNVGISTDEVGNAIHRICGCCSDEKAKQLADWWKTRSGDMAWGYTGFADTIAERIMGKSINAKLPDNMVYLNSVINSLAIACSDEVATRLKNWWEETQNN